MVFSNVVFYLIFDNIVVVWVFVFIDVIIEWGLYSIYGDCCVCGIFGVVMMFVCDYFNVVIIMVMFIIVNDFIKVIIKVIGEFVVYKWLNC